MNTLALVDPECQLESNQRFGAPSLLLHYPMAAVSLSVSTVKPLGDRAVSYTHLTLPTKG